MSIRIGLYDFFAYTLPGIFHLAIIGFWLNASGLMRIDLTTLNELSLSFLFVLLGVAYITGLLIDPLGYKWIRLFQGRNRDAAKAAYNEFINRHKWLSLDFEASDWVILLRAWFSKLPERDHQTFTIYVRDRLPDDQDPQVVNEIFDPNSDEIAARSKSLERPKWLTKEAKAIKVSLESFPYMVS